MAEKHLVISSSPHIRGDLDVPKIMWSVVLALLPATLAGAFFFGLHALVLVGVCIASAVGAEWVFLRCRRRSVPISDGSAVITGLLLALCLPPSIPLWAAALGSIVAIWLGKQIFGGLGYNVFNPALIGRAFLAAAFPVYMTKWSAAEARIRWAADAITGATPLAAVKWAPAGTAASDVVRHLRLDLLLGKCGGCLGETSVVAILVGAVFLLARGMIDWRIPAGYLGTVTVFSGALWLINPDRFADPLFHLTAGGLMLGAFFMATDMVTSPVTPRGVWIYACGMGVLLVVIRTWGGLPEGVMYSILLMNSCVPLLDRYTRPRRLGEGAVHA